MAERRMVTITEAAHRCRVCERTIARWIDRGDLAAVRVGRRRLIPEQDVDALLTRSAA